MNQIICFLRLPDVLRIIPVCRATWYNGIKQGRFTAPVKCGARLSMWRMSDIQKLVVDISNSNIQ
ncbi:AlpA family phage regulatory protein [Leeia sp. TBRC 13508]|uniref:AlpA family phage regulatory protein n=1 Tax=Leeia speluncae TaxID=2884804 RepID=A0ABS8D7N2_9NEIS|nr:AlpA family phage regulatory protein [Leeia speluncae]